MPSRAVVASSDEESTTTTRVKREKVKVKSEGRKTRSRPQIEEEDEVETQLSQRNQDEENEGDDNDDDNDDDASGQEAPKGNKRRRINGDGDSVASRAVSREQEENPASQIPKHEFKTLPRDDDGYIPGSIVRVQLQNFVTYDFVEFRPGPYLNMIIGPNGTGKSSIACAICLGLNFPPSTLGRATDLRSFVKLGAATGYIEIELKGPKGKPNLIIRRSLNSEKNTSTFSLNGKSVAGQEIKAKMNELNVQVGNLCTFLPQDKVSSFAAMTPQELLRETQRAAGDNRLTQWHESLIRLGKDLTDLNKKQEEDEKLKNDNQQRVEMMEHSVRLFKERQELERKRDILGCVIPVEKYRLKHAEYMRIKKNHRALHQRASRLRDRNAPLHNLLERLKDDANAAEAKLKDTRAAQQKRIKKCNGIHGALDDVDRELDEIHAKIDELKNEEKSRLSQIKKTEADIDALQKELAKPVAQTEDPELLKEQEKQANLEKLAVDQRHRELKPEFEAYADQRGLASAELDRAKATIQKFNGADGVKLNNMEKWHRDTHDAILWLRENKHLFKMEVFEPPYMCMKVPDARYADAVEALMNSAQLRTFVAQCKEDVDALNHHINDTNGLGRKARIVTWYRGHNEAQLSPPPMSQEELKFLGFDGYALEYIDCPEGLKWFLKRECAFHRNAIALDASGVDVARAMEAVARPEAGGGASFINGNVMNTVQRSRYGSRAVNNMTRDIQKARNLSVQTIDPEVRKNAEKKVQECEQQLALFDEQKKELSQRQTEINADDGRIQKILEEIKKKKDVIRQQHSKRVTSENRLKRLKGNLVSLKNKPSEEEQKKKLTKKLLQLNFKRAEKIKEITVVHKAFLPEQSEVTRLALEVLQIDANISALKTLCEEKTAKYEAAMRQYNQINQRFIAVKTESKECLEAAKEAVQNCPEEVNEEATQINQARKNYYEQLSKWEEALNAAGGDETKIRDVEKPVAGEDDDLRSLEELETALGQIEAELDMNNNRDGTVVAQYEARMRTIETLETAMADRRKRIDKTGEKVRRTRNQWEPALRSLIDEIRNQFSNAFDRIGCAGDIELMPDPDYEKWRVDIKVKFRDNERLQLLTGQRQSGGERSLTTILYLMSLTTLAHTPFSLVDEINQGMDKRAERMVHNSMVEVTCKAESSQYFLITPKLLPDLRYHPRMKVLCVNNGEWLPEAAGGNMRKMIRDYVACRGQGNQ